MLKAGLWDSQLHLHDIDDGWAPYISRIGKIVTFVYKYDISVRVLPEWGLVIF